MRLADCRRRDLFWKPRRARAAGCPMQSCKPLLHGQGWLLRCRDCGFSRGELGTQNPTHPFMLAAFAIAACWGSASKAWTHGSWPGFAVIKIWLKREILTAALRPATWNSPRAPRERSGGACGQGCFCGDQSPGSTRHTPPGGGQRRNSLCRWEPETPLPVLSADRRRSGQNTSYST